MRRRRTSPGSSVIAPAIALVIALASCGGGSPTVAQSLPPLPSISPSPPVSPSPSVDPMMQPRLDGRYTVLKKVTSVRNFKGIAVGDVLHRTYHVAASCPIGPCGGAVTIDLAESKTTIKRRLAYDAATLTYTLVPVISPVICTGTDGRRYALKHTTDSVVITPVKAAPTGVDIIATTWTAVEVLKAVPEGKALTRGHCRTSVIDYRYTASLA